MTVCPLGAESETVKPSVAVPALPSATATSSIESTGTPASSLPIVPMPWLSEIVALTGALRLTTRISSGSFFTSPFTVTLTGWVVTPGAKVSVPEAAR